MAFISATKRNANPIYINVNNIIAAFPSETTEGKTIIQVTGQAGTGSLYSHEVNEPYQVIKTAIESAFTSGF